MRPALVYVAVLIDTVIRLLPPDVVLFIELVLHILGHLLQLVTVGLILLRDAVHDVCRIERRNHITFLHRITDFDID